MICKQCNNEISNNGTKKLKQRKYCDDCNKKRHIQAVQRYQAKKQAVNME